MRRSPRELRDRRMLRDLRAFVEVLHDAPAQVPDRDAAWAAVREMHEVLYPSQARVELGFHALVQHVLAVADPEPGAHAWGPWRDQDAATRTRTMGWLRRALARHVHHSFATLEPRKVAELLDAYAPTKRKGRMVAARIAAELALAVGAWGQGVTAADRQGTSTEPARMASAAARLTHTIETATRKHGK